MSDTQHYWVGHLERGEEIFGPIYTICHAVEVGPSRRIPNLRIQ